MTPLNGDIMNMKPAAMISMDERQDAECHWGETRVAKLTKRIEFLRGTANFSKATFCLLSRTVLILLSVSSCLAKSIVVNAELMVFIVRSLFTMIDLRLSIDL